MSYVCRTIARLGLAAALLGLPAPAAAEPPQAPFAHSDDGPVTVLHGAQRTRLPRAGAGPAVRAYLDAVDAALARGTALPAERLQALAERGRTLQAQDTALTGTLYLEAALRRLHRARLARVPVDTTQVHARYAARYPQRFDKPVVLRRGHDDLGVRYATLAACLELARVPGSAPPREVRVEPDGALWTRLDGTPLALDLVPFQGTRMLLRSVVLGSSRSLGFKDKAQVARLLLEHCLE
jgi:hypothetical protein